MLTMRAGRLNDIVILRSISILLVVLFILFIFIIMEVYPISILLL